MCLPGQNAFTRSKRFGKARTGAVVHAPGGATVQHANHLQPFSKAGKFWQRVLTAPGSLNIEPPPKMPSILPTLRPLFSPSAFSLTLRETQKHLKFKKCLKRGTSAGRHRMCTPLCRNMSTLLNQILRGSGTFFLM